MVCKVIDHVLVSWFPVLKILLFHPVYYPIKSHIYCLGLSPLEVALMIPSAVGLSVLIRLIGWKNEFIESNAEGYGYFPIVKKSTYFCFGIRS